MRRPRIFFYWIVVAALVVITVSLQARCALGAHDVLDATVRLFDSEKSPAGTGTVFANSDGKLYISTCHHVVGSKSSLSCEFYRDGYTSQKITGRVVLRGRPGSADGAVLTVPVAAFGADGPPKPIPWAPRGQIVNAGDTILSVGCAHGAWATLFRGHVVKVDAQNGLIYFRPGPAGGRSGSAIFDAKGEKILGILFARTGGDKHGLATSVEVFYWLWGGRASTLNSPTYRLCGTRRLERVYHPAGSCVWRIDSYGMPIVPVQWCPGGDYPGGGRPQAEPDAGGASIFPGLPWARQPLPRRQSLPRSGQSIPVEDVKKALESLQAQLKGLGKQLETPKPKLQPAATVTEIAPSNSVDIPWAAVLDMAAWGLGALGVYVAGPLGLIFLLASKLAPVFGSRLALGAARRMNDPKDLESNQAVELIGRLAANGANGGKKQ